MYKSTATLEDVLRLALPAGTELLVGEDALARPVSWACSLRPSPPAFPKLEGDELALIDMDDLRRLDPNMRLERVVHSLQGAHVAAIAVQGAIAKPAIQTARAERIALIHLPQDEPLMQIERAVIRLIVDRAGYIAQRSAELQRELNQTALDGGGLDQIATHIYQFAQQPIVLLRDDGNTSACVGFERLPEKRRQTVLGSLPNMMTLRSWVATQSEQNLNNTVGILPLTTPTGAGTADTNHNASNGAVHAHAASREEGRGAAVTYAAEKRNGENGEYSEVVVAPIVANESVHGYCLLLRPAARTAQPISAVEQIAVTQGAAAAALEWAKQNAVDLAEERMRATFLDELLASEIADEQAWIQRGMSLGYELARPHVAWMVQAHNVGSWPRPLLRFAEEQGVNVPASQRDEGMLIFWPIDNPNSGRELKGVANEFVERVRAASPQAEITVGIGRPGVGPSQWFRSQQQARESWRLGKTWKGTSVTYFGDLGLYQLLTGLGNNAEAARFYRKTLGKLMSHDEEHNAELVDTLEAFFTCHGNLSQTAARLHIHRNTLTYRLERISEITQLDLNDADARFSLQLALKLRPVI